MAIYALTSQVVTLNSVDYSDHLKSATLTLDAAQLDTTDFASGGWTEVIGGLKSGTLALEFMDDVADNDVDEELFALLGTVVAFAIKATSAAIGAGNPEYQGSVLVTGHSLGGAVGELAMKSLTFPTSGAITRDITP
jgi:predicted secreted protein